MRLDRDTVLRTLRALLLLGLAWELLDTLGYPATKIRVAENIYAPLWHIETRSTSPIYSSSALLHRCQSTMAYNTSSGVFKTGPLSLWTGSEAMFTANPAAGWATWQQLIMQARNPWAVYWASKFVPESWHIMPRIMRENMELLQAAVPVLTPDNSIVSRGSISDSEDGGALAGLFDADGLLSPDDGFEYVSRWVALCHAPVNQTTLQPVDVAYCTVTERGNDTNIAGAFQVQHSWQRIMQQKGVATESIAQQNKLKQAADAVLYTGPMAESLQLAGDWLRQYWPLDYAVRVLSWVWQYTVPTGSLNAVQPLLLQLRVLEIEWEWEVLVVYCIVLLVCFRNWIYLLCVAYKVSRRLALLAFHAPLDRFNGALLTFVGMFLGLWQAMGYAVLDMAVDVALTKLQVYAISHFSAASWVWYISFEWGLFEMRGVMRLYNLAKAAWADIKALVRNPQAIVVAQQAFDKPPPRQVATIGPWPAPLSVPDEVDDLPVAEVPRGFICPITQAIMRQPALLLHDATVTPSTYDKEAITQWLSEHSSDPKNPGAKLNMKSVKLVYNGDLARAIEDWVAATLATRRNTSQQASLAMLEQRLAQLRMRAQSTLWQQQQQQQQQQPGQQQQQQQQQPAPGVQWQLGQQPNEQQQQQQSQQEDGNPFAGAEGAAAAALAGEGGAAAAAGGGAASGALHLMRQSSAAIAQVASMDIPAVAAAGLATLADTTRRITTRAAARRLHQQQMQQLRQQQGQQPQQEAVAAADAGGDGAASSNSSDAHTGPSAAAAWGFDDGAAGDARRRSARVKYRARRATPLSPE